MFRILTVRSSNRGTNKRLFLLQKVQIGPGAHSHSCPIGKGALCRRQYGWGVKLATHHNILPRLRISGGVHLLPPKCLRGVERDSCTFITAKISLRDVSVGWIVADLTTLYQPHRLLTVEWCQRIITFHGRLMYLYVKEDNEEK